MEKNIGKHGQFAVKVLSFSIFSSCHNSIKNTRKDLKLLRKNSYSAFLDVNEFSKYSGNFLTILKVFSALIRKKNCFCHTEKKAEMQVT